MSWLMVLSLLAMACLNVSLLKGDDGDSCTKHSKDKLHSQAQSKPTPPPRSGAPPYPDDPEANGNPAKAWYN